MQLGQSALVHTALSLISKTKKLFFLYNISYWTFSPGVLASCYVFQLCLHYRYVYISVLFTFLVYSTKLGTFKSVIDAASWRCMAM